VAILSSKLDHLFILLMPLLVERVGGVIIDFSFPNKLQMKDPLRMHPLA
jgi:hypothetical protein